MMKKIWNFVDKNCLVFIRKEAGERYEFDIEKAVLVGFSNGSNIAINLMLRSEAPFKKALLYAPLYPIEEGQQRIYQMSVCCFLWGNMIQLCH